MNCNTINGVGFPHFKARVYLDFVMDLEHAIVIFCNKAGTTLESFMCRYHLALTLIQ